jgi:hypothetical protein
MFLPRHCLATYTQRLTRLLGGIYKKHVDQMGSCAMIYVPSGIKIGSESVGGYHRHTENRMILQTLFIFSKKRERERERTVDRYIISARFLHKIRYMHELEMIFCRTILSEVSVRQNKDI